MGAVNKDTLPPEDQSAEVVGSPYNLRRFFLPKAAIPAEMELFHAITA